MLNRFLISMLTIIFAGAGVSLAQTRDFAEREVNRLDQKLGLTAEQKTRVKDILKENQAEFEKLQQQNRGDREAIRSAEIDMDNTLRSQIQMILTAEQQEKFAAIKDSIHLPRPWQDQRLKEMNDRLKLTDEQSDQIADIMADTQAKIDSLRDQNAGDWQSMRPVMQKIRAESDQKIENLLTAEQKTEYEKMKDEWGQQRGGPRPGMGRNRRGF